VNADFSRGVRHGIPICLGYLSVSFGFGIMAAKSGLSLLASTLISVTNLTSAGQAAGVAIIAAGGGLLEMALTQIVINIRYSLMAISLSQRLDDSFTTRRRLLAAYGITDEIFAVASVQPFLITPAYMYGLIFISALGWTAGTFLGAASGQFFPAALTNALGIVLYGMFLAIIIPPARKHLGVLAVVLTAAGISVVLKYCFPAVSGGFAVIISSVAAACMGAVCFPVRQEEEEA